IGKAALLLERFGGAGLVPLDEVVLVFGLHRRGGDDVDHEFSPWFLLDYRTSTFSGVMTSIFGGDARHFTTTRPKVFMCSAVRCGTSASAFSHCSTNTI